MNHPLFPDLKSTTGLTVFRVSASWACSTVRAKTSQQLTEKNCTVEPSDEYIINYGMCSLRRAVCACYLLVPLLSIVNYDLCDLIRAVRACYVLVPLLSIVNYIHMTYVILGELFVPAMCWSLS